MHVTVSHFHKYSSRDKVDIASMVTPPPMPPGTTSATVRTLDKHNYELNLSPHSAKSPLVVRESCVAGKHALIAGATNRKAVTSKLASVIVLSKRFRSHRNATRPNFDIEGNPFGFIS